MRAAKEQSARGSDRLLLAQVYPHSLAVRGSVRHCRLIRMGPGHDRSSIGSGPGPAGGEPMTSGPAARPPARTATPKCGQSLSSTRGLVAALGQDSRAYIWLSGGQRLLVTLLADQWQAARL